MHLSWRGKANFASLGLRTISCFLFRRRAFVPFVMLKKQFLKLISNSLSLNKGNYDRDDFISPFPRYFYISFGWEDIPNTQEAGVALGCASSKSYASVAISKFLSAKYFPIRAIS